jgi:hypothetical protein
VDRLDGLHPFGEVAAARLGRLLQPVVVRGQVELAGAAGDAGALLDRHQPLVLAQALPGLARERVEIGESALDVAQHLVQLVLADRGVAAQRVEERALAVQFLQEIALQVRAARDLEDLEDAGERGVVVVRVVETEEVIDPGVEILQPEQRADALVEGIFVDDHQGLAEDRPVRSPSWEGGRIVSHARRC